jgi:hypothetical protein
LHDRELSRLSCHCCRHLLASPLCGCYELGTHTSASNVKPFHCPNRVPFCCQCLEANRLRVTANCIWVVRVEANRVRVEANRVRVEANRVTVEANRVTVEANRVRVKANRVRVEANRVRVKVNSVIYATPMERYESSEPQVLYRVKVHGSQTSPTRFHFAIMLG